MKKLYRSKKEMMVAGVLGGIGEYSQIDPTLLRIGFVALTLFTGIIPGLIIYIVGVIIIPIKGE